MTGKFLSWIEFKFSINGVITNEFSLNLMRLHMHNGLYTVYVYIWTACKHV